MVADRILEDSAGIVHAEWLVVREKIPPVGKVVFRDFVIAPVDGVVGTLEKTVFAVVDKFDPGQVPGLRVEQSGDKRTRHHGGGRDIVFHLDLGRREEIFAQPEGAPRVLRVEADAQEIGHQFAAVEAQLVGRQAVDRIDTEILPPMLAPIRAVEPFEHVDQLLDVLRDRLEPRIVLRTEGWRRGEQFDHRTEGTVGTQNQPVILAIPRRIGVTIRVVVTDKLVDLIEVGLDVGDKDRPLQDGIRDRLGNFRLAPARDGARFVAERPLGHRADEPPSPAGRWLGHLDFVAAGQDVAVLELERDLPSFPVLLPGHSLREQLESRILGDIKNVRMVTVDRVTLRMYLDGVAEQLHGLGKSARHVQGQIPHRNLLGQVVARKNERPARMLLLGIAEKIGRHPELRFDLLFAVAKVVVGNDRHHHTALVARRDLESCAVIVNFIRRFPAHPVAPLALGRFAPGRQSELGLGQLVEVRGQDDAAGVPGPMFGVERGIMVREIRITRIAENALDKVEIANQAARHEEAHLHTFLRRHSGHLGADHRPEQEGNKALGRGRKGRGEGQAQQFRRRIERRFEQASEDRFRHRFLVVGHRQAAFRDMKYALRGPAITLRVVQHALPHAVGVDDVGRKFVLVRRQGQLPGKPVPVESKGLVGQARHFGHILQVIIQKILDPRIGGRKMLGQQTVLLPIQRHQPADQIGEFRILLDWKGGATKVPQFEVDVEDAPSHRVRILAAARHAAQRADFLFQVLIHDKLRSRFNAENTQRQESREEITLATLLPCRQRLAPWEKNCPSPHQRGKRNWPWPFRSRRAFCFLRSKPWLGNGQVRQPF